MGLESGRQAARKAAGVIAAALLAACGGGATPEPTPSPSSGQVTPPAATRVSYYAASRFAEQTSFGPTPALVAELQAKGFSTWIDEQFAKPASTVALSSYLGYPDPSPPEDWLRYRAEFPRLAVAGADQLRLRVTWALSQFIVVSDRKADMVATMYWINLLQQHAFGRYGDLLYDLSINPTMGWYLDNSQNRPKSAECPHCAPNENFARELMQLFSLGVFKLNPDGTPVRDTQGRFVETYAQRDVEELARVLTGWSFDPVPAVRPNRNFGNWGKPMVPTTWPPERDAGAKTVLGKSFPAGQTQAKDLQDAVAMLMTHQNTAPFVASRLIQHLVKSNPTPAYVARVAARFIDNGAGVRGDMKAVVKAVLLDAEARAGDNPATARVDDGKLREPFLYTMAVWRGMGCTTLPLADWGPQLPQSQAPFNAESVFSFYAPTDRAPGSNLLAPEQRLINSQELSWRLNLINSHRWDQALNQNTRTRLKAAGCAIDALTAAYAQSPRAFGDFLAQRYFRGSLPPTLRNDIERLIREPQWDTRTPDDGAVRLTDFALATPYYGVIK